MAQIALWSISDVEQELQGMLHGTTLNQITDLFGVFNRAGRRVIEDIDPQETKIVSQFGKVYDCVWDYPLAADVKGNKVIDLFPQANRNLRDNFSQVYNKNFDLWKQFTFVPNFTPRYNAANRTIRIDATELNTGISINQANAYNGNGTFVAGTNVSSVTTNNQLTTDGGSGSVQFNIAQTGVVGSVATITNTTGTAVDLSAQYNNADEFFAIYLPNASGITSVEYKFGTNSSNYYDSGAITTDMMGNAFVNGWNYIKIPWSSFSIVGSPTITSLGQYVSVSITYNGTLQTQVLLNQFWSRLGVIFNQEYYSKYLFRNATTGVFQERVTDESNLVNLDTDGLDCFVWSVVREAVQQQQGLDASFSDGPNAEQRYQDAVAKYKAKYKSEIIKPGSSYYQTPNASYRQYIGRGYYTS